MQAIQDLREFFRLHFDKFNDSHFHLYLSLIDSFADYKNDFYSRELDRIKHFSEDLVLEYPFVIISDHLNLMIGVCLMFGNEFDLNQKSQNLMGERAYLNDSHNQLLNLIDNAPSYVHYDYPLSESTNISEIKFYTKDGKSLKLVDRNDILNLMAILKREKHWIYGDKVSLTKKECFTNRRGEMAKMLHKYSELKSNIVFSGKYRTSNKICKLIYEIFLFSKMTSIEESGNSNPEDYIRVLILRCKSI